jgi:hypothetical protein
MAIIHSFDSAFQSTSHSLKLAAADPEKPLMAAALPSGGCCELPFGTGAGVVDGRNGQASF